MAKDKKQSEQDREYEELMKELQDAQDDKFLLDPDFDELSYAYGGKIMKKSYGGKMRGYGKARSRRP